MSARSRRGDVVLTIALLVIFAGAYALSLGWPLRTALFPRLLAATGALLALLMLAVLAVQTRRVAASDQIPGADQGDDSVEYVFASAGRHAWTAALGWIAGFFVSLWLLGAVPTVPLFALLYLRFAGKTGWLAAAAYALVAGAFVWLALGRLLSVPMPTGVF